MEEIVLGFFDHLLLFLLGVLLPLFAVFQSQADMKEMTFDTQMKKQVYYGNGLFQWICAGLVLALWWGNDRPWGTLGLQTGEWSPLAWQLLGVFLLLYIIDVFREIGNAKNRESTRKKWLKDIPILPVNFTEFKHFIFVAFTAGVCEEIIFRGFFVNYFLSLNQNNELGNWLAVIIPGFMFAFGHLYQGDKAVLKIIIMAVLFGWIFLLTKSLLLLIFVHFLIDVIGGFLAYQLLKDVELPSSSEQ